MASRFPHHFGNAVHKQSAIFLRSQLINFKVLQKFLSPSKETNFSRQLVTTEIQHNGSLSTIFGEEKVLPSWNIAPRAIPEAVLSHYATQKHPVSDILFFVGPKGAGKRTVIKRLLPNWNKEPHCTALVDLSKIRNLNSGVEIRSSVLSNITTESFEISKARLETERSLEAVAIRGVFNGAIDSSSVYSALKNGFSVKASLCHVLRESNAGAVMGNSDEESLFQSGIAMAANIKILEPNFGSHSDKSKFKFEEWLVKHEEGAPAGTALLALALAKQVLRVHEVWRLSKKLSTLRDWEASWKVDKSLASAELAWTSFLIDLLSASSSPGVFQPKLVIYGMDVLRRSQKGPPGVTSPLAFRDSLFHDALLTKLLSPQNTQTFPIVLSSSDSYYSDSVLISHDFPTNVRFYELFSWSVKEASIYLVPHTFSKPQWAAISANLGGNPCHLSSFYWLWSQQRSTLHDQADSVEACLEDFLKHFYLTDFLPALNSSLESIQAFPMMAASGKLPPQSLDSGFSWSSANWQSATWQNDSWRQLWARIQLADFVQSLISTQFGVNYDSEAAQELEWDPCFQALLDAGILYRQNNPTYVRPSSQAMELCLKKWLDIERGKWPWQTRLRYYWQRLYRGRNYNKLLSP